MRNFSETNITDAVVARVAAAPSPRVREVSAALVRHLHAFLREVRPTQREWEAGIAFLTETGKACSDVRQEFILLSDTLGASTLVDAINHDRPGATDSTVLGPFHVEGAPEVALGADLSDGAPGRPLRVEGTVRDTSGRPVAGAWIDTWHCDGDGFYDVQKDGAHPAMRARLRTDPGGRFWLRSVVPSSYPIPHDGPVGRMLEAQGRHPHRPAHVHFMVGAPGHETLVTHVFLAGDAYLDSDAVFGVKDSLVRALEGDGAGGAAVLRYDFVLAPSAAA